MTLSTRSTSEQLSSAHDRVYRTLRTRIMHGEIAPGEALTPRGIGHEFDVSMTPAREAVRRLVAEGALFLSSSGRVSTPELSNERIEELAALRSLLEVELSSRALPRAHMALIDRLQRNVDSSTHFIGQYLSVFGPGMMLRGRVLPQAPYCRESLGHRADAAQGPA